MAISENEENLLFLQRTKANHEERKSSVMSYQVSDDSHAEMTWNDLRGFPNSSWQKISNIFRSHIMQHFQQRDNISMLWFIRKHLAWPQVILCTYCELEHIISKIWVLTTWSAIRRISQSMNYLNADREFQDLKCKKSSHKSNTVSLPASFWLVRMSSTPFPGSHSKHSHLAWKCPFASDSLIPLMTN